MGFLVDKSWIDNWKEYSFYDNIKKEYSINKKKSKVIIIDRIKKERTSAYIKQAKKLQENVINLQK